MGAHSSAGTGRRGSDGGGNASPLSLARLVRIAAGGGFIIGLAAQSKDVSFNQVVIQCCEYSLKNLKEI